MSEIRINPPLTVEEMAAGGVLDLLRTIHLLPAEDGGADTIQPREGMNYYPHWVLANIQSFVDRFPTHEFTGFVEFRNTNAGQPPIARYVMRGRKVVRVDAHIGWPTEPDANGVDPEHEALLQILYAAGDGGTFVQVCAGDFDRPAMVNADETDLTERLLAWRDAAVQAATADLRRLLEAAERREDELVVHIDKLEAATNGLSDEYGILDHGGPLFSAKTEPTVMAAENMAIAVEVRAKGIFAPDSRRPASLMRRQATDWEEIPEGVTPDDIMPGYSGHKADTAREAGS